MVKKHSYVISPPPVPAGQTHVSIYEFSMSIINCPGLKQQINSKVHRVQSTVLGLVQVVQSLSLQKKPYMEGKGYDSDFVSCGTPACQSLVYISLRLAKL